MSPLADNTRMARLRAHVASAGVTRDRTLAIAYVRVSTAEQADERASLDAQRHLFAQEAERRE